MSKHPAHDVLRKNLQEGTLPSNVELQKGIQSTKQALDTEVAKRGTSVPEAKLAQDTSQLLSTTQQFIQEKNRGDLLQKFIADTQDAIQELNTQMNSKEFWIQRTKLMLSAQQQASNLNQVAQINVESMKNLAITFVNSAEFRALILEFINLAQSMVDIEQQRAGPLPSLTPEQTTTIPLTEEAKLKMQQTTQVAQNVFTDISQGKLEVPEDRKQLIRQRFRDLINKLNADPNFQQAVNGLFYLFDQIQFYGFQLKEQARQQTQQLQGSLNTSAMWRMWGDGKAFVAGFTGMDLLDKFNADTMNFINLVSNDQRLTQYFWDIRNFLTAVIKNPALFDTDDFVQKWNDLYAYSYTWTNDPRYRDLLWGIYGELYLMLVSFQKDKWTQQMQQDLNRVARDLVLDESGKPNLSIMTQGLSNLSTLIAPIIRKNLENVPVPGFSGSDETYDWQVQSMFINASTIVPENFEVKVWGDAKVSLSDQSTSKANTYVTMWIRDIGFQAKDLKYHFVRKSIPRVDESGIADVCIPDKGTVIKIVWKIVGEQNQPWIWSIYQVRCDLKDLDITVKTSTHTWLMKFITTLFSGSIRRSIEDKIEQSIAEGLGTINDKLNETIQNVPKIY